MKILVLMPLDEKYTYTALGIYNNLPFEIKQKCFMMPTFMDYLVTIKLAPNWEQAAFDALVASEKLYNAAVQKKDDIIVIGNINKEYEFDAVFNFQDEKEEEPYSDSFLDKLKAKIAASSELTEEERSLLSKHIDNLYVADDSKLSLVNFTATADLLTAYLQTDPKLDIIKKEYEDKLKELKELQSK